jgi:hypothetical protein
MLGVAPRRPVLEIRFADFTEEETFGARDARAVVGGHLREQE